MDLTIVGCSGSLPGPQSPASCYLLTASDGTRDWRVLLDLGSGAFGALQRHTDPDSLDAVVLSHLHPDHCLDLTALQVWRAHGPSRSGADLPVYGPVGTAERMARAYGVDEPFPMTGMTFRALADAHPFTIGPFRVMPYRVRHPVTTFGVRVEADGAVLAYTGDTDSCPGLVPLMAGADVVLAEAAFVEGRDETRGMHLTGRRAAQAVVEAEQQGGQGPVGRLLLTHLPPWTAPAVVLAEAQDVWDGATEVVRPGATYQLGPGAARADYQDRGAD